MLAFLRVDFFYHLSSHVILCASLIIKLLILLYNYWTKPCISNNPEADEILEQDEFMLKKYTSFTKQKQPLKTTVAQPLTDFQVLDDYNLPKTKGLALLINIKYFSPAPNNVRIAERSGSQYELQYMRSVWGQLGYQIYGEKDIDAKNEHWTKQDLLKIIEDFHDTCLFLKPPSIVVFIGSHGLKNKIVTSDAPMRSWWSWLNPFLKNCHHPVTVHLWDDLIVNFYDKNCPALIGKPKIFLVNGCQLAKRENIVFRWFPMINRYSVSDLVICASKVPKFESYQASDLGSCFVHCLAFVLMTYAKEMTLLGMLRMIRELMKDGGNFGVHLTRGEILVIQEYGMKNLYFFTRSGERYWFEGWKLKKRI